jgi:hypothetical protein
MKTRSRLLDKIKATLRRVILSDRVRPFVWVYSVALLTWGIYSTFFAAPVTYVLPVMGQRVYDAWVWLHIIAPSIVMCGLTIEDKAKSIRLVRHGVHLQTGGLACMFFILLAYEVSAITAAAWGQGTYSIFVIVPYVIGCLLLTVQGVVKIVTAEQIKP